jgi:uncharacterized membrane protein
MAQPAANPDRLRMFSDGVFAIVMTILVLELRPPQSPTFADLLSLWPTGLSYAVSYLFLAIVWVNHHHVLRYADAATPRLIWGNFAHLFAVSLIPFSMAWIANSNFAAVPVAVYATVFVLVNVTYIALCWEVVDRPNIANVSPRARRTMRIRSFLTLALFAAAAVVALRSPMGGLALICCCLILYLRPEAPLATA